MTSNMFNNLKNIAKGWYTFANTPVELKGVIEARLEICDTCDDKTQMSPLAEEIISIINDAANTFKCGKCGCPLASSTASMPYACFAGKWRAINEVEEALIMSDPVTYTLLYETTIDTAFDDFNYDESSGGIRPLEVDAS